MLESLAKRAYPSYELFVFALLCGASLGVGYLRDSQAFLIFGVLMAPLLTPWVGMILATVNGSGRFFFQTLLALLIAGFLVFISGGLAGVAARFMLPLTLNQAFIHSRLWWEDLVVLALGAIILTLSFVRSEEKPYLPSAMLAYGIFLPLSAAGFGLGSGVADIWPQGLYVFFVYLAWVSLFGMLTLVFMRFRPLTLTGYGCSLVVLLIVVMTLVELTGFREAAWSRISGTPIATTAVPAGTSTPAIDVVEGANPQTPSPTPFEAATVTPTLPTTATPDRTAMASLTMLFTDTATPTISPEPTPVFARIKSVAGGGAFVRSEPGGRVLVTLDNGSYVVVLPERQEIDSIAWIHVIATVNEKEYEGWIIQSVLVTATPVADW